MKYIRILLIIAVFSISFFGMSQDYCLKFYGTPSTAKVDLGTGMSVYNTQSLTVEMWVNITNLRPNDCFFSLPGTNYTLSFNLGTPWNMVRVDFDTGTASTPSNVIYDSEWFFLSFVFDGTQAANVDRVKIYINGVQQTLSFKSTIPTVTPTAASTSVLLGANAGSSKLFTGYMDDFAIWSTCRTITEIQSDMGSNISGNETGLLAYLPLDERDDASTAPDSSPNSVNGTLVDFPADHVASPYWTLRSVSEPGTQATNVTASNIYATQQDLSWTNGSGSSRAVFMAQTTTGSAAPVDNTTYAANASFGNGDQIGTSGWYCIYNGTGTSVKVSGLSASTDYRVMVCEYNGDSSAEDYNVNTSSDNPIDVPTNSTSAPITEPTTEASNLSATPDANTCNISWTNGDGISRAVFVKLASSGSAVPVDGTTYTAISVFGSGSQIGTSGWYCVYNGTETSVTISGLSVPADYRVMVCEYNGSASNENYIISTATLNPLNFSTSALAWTGTSGTDWGTASNWEGSSVPTSSDDVVIPSGLSNYPVINSNSAACEDIIINSGASLTINAGKDLTISGNLTNSGTFVISSGASSSGSLIINGTSSGNITYQRYVSGSKWHMISSPVSGQDIGDLLLDGSNDIVLSGSDYSMKHYIESSDSWSDSYTSAVDGDFVMGQGYAAKRNSDGVISFTGNANSNTVSVSINCLRHGWTLIGNPYTSAIGITTSASSAANCINANSAVMDASFTALYLWDEQDNYTGNRNDYKTISNAGGGLSQHYIQVGQGFFVKSKSGGGNFEFTSDMQSHQPTVDFKSTEEIWPTIRLKVQSGELKSYTEVCYHDDMTRGLDVSYDAGMLKANPCFALYSRLIEDNGIDFAMQCLPVDYENLVVPIGIDASIGDDIIFTVETLNLPEDYVAVIEDRKKEVFIYLSNDSDYYSAEVEQDDFSIERFFLHTKKTLSQVTEIPNNELHVSALPNENCISITGKIDDNTFMRIFDVTGKEIYKTELQQSSNEIYFEAKTGVYIVNIQSTNLNISTKINWVK